MPRSASSWSTRRTCAPQPKLAATFATYVRIAARSGEVISQSGIGQKNVGENSFTSAEVATINSALEYAAARHVTFVCGSGGYGVPGIGATRGVPDVAGDASVYTGLAYVRSAPGGTYMLSPTGGTSASAPLWAGPIALADQEAGHPLGFVNPAIYRIARGPLYHKAFHGRADKVAYSATSRPPAPRSRIDAIAPQATATPASTMQPSRTPWMSPANAERMPRATQ
jgi:hypothetical protein